MVFFQLNGFVITFIKKFKIYVPLDKLFWHWIIVYYREKGRFSWKVILYHCRLHTYEYLTQKKIIPICTHSVEFDSFYWAEIYGRPRIWTVGGQKFVQYIHMLWPGRFILIESVCQKAQKNGKCISSIAQKD